MAQYFRPDQERHIDPYEQRIFDYNTEDSKVYLSRDTNLLLKSIGNNIVLDGLFIVDLVQSVSNIISMTVQPGDVIQDWTYLEFKSTTPITLDIDVTPYTDTVSDSDHLGVFVDYQFIHTATENPAYIRVYHVSADGEVISPEPFDEARCMLLLAIIAFDKTDPNFIHLIYPGTLIVRGKLMTARGSNDDVSMKDMIRRVAIEGNVPSGGTSGQVLAKNSNDDFDTHWITNSSGTGTTSGTSGTSAIIAQLQLDGIGELSEAIISAIEGGGV